MKIIGIVVSIVTGALLLMALAACIAVVRAEECMRALEEMKEMKRLYRNIEQDGCHIVR